MKPPEEEGACDQLLSGNAVLGHNWGRRVVNRALPVCRGPACQALIAFGSRGFALPRGRRREPSIAVRLKCALQTAISIETALQLHPPPRCPELLRSSVCHVAPVAVQLPCKSNCNPIPCPPLPRTFSAVACAVSHLWLGNLMEYPTEKSLRQEFERFGEVEDVRGGCCVRGLSLMGGIQNSV